jgi:hypothetical protein
MIGMGAVDPSTVFVLAAIALAEGITRVPADALVFRRVFLGPWQVSGPPGRDRLRLVQWWSPWTEALIIPPMSITTPPLSRAELHRRLRATASIRRTARVIGAMTLLALVLGIPAGIGSAGFVGGLMAAGCVLAGQVALGLLGWFGLRVLGAPLRVQVRLAAATLNPFAAPGAASRLLAAAAAGAPPLAAANTLLTPDRWMSWFRPRAYDAGVALAPDRELTEGFEEAHQAIALALARRPTMASHERWCPRCAATYQSGFTACAECDVTLLGATDTVM